MTLLWNTTTAYEDENNAVPKATSLPHKWRRLREVRANNLRNLIWSRILGDDLIKIYYNFFATVRKRVSLWNYLPEIVRTRKTVEGRCFLEYNAV